MKLNNEVEYQMTNKALNAQLNSLISKINNVEPKLSQKINKILEKETLSFHEILIEIKKTLNASKGFRNKKFITDVINDVNNILKTIPLNKEQEEIANEAITKYIQPTYHIQSKIFSYPFTLQTFSSTGEVLELPEEWNNLRSQMKILLEDSLSSSVYKRENSLSHLKTVENLFKIVEKKANPPRNKEEKECIEKWKKVLEEINEKIYSKIAEKESVPDAAKSIFVREGVEQPLVFGGPKEKSKTVRQDEKKENVEKPKGP